MFDADAPADFNEVRHWLVMNIPESFIECGDEVTAYLGSGTRSGIHRYIFLVYKQANGKIEHNEPRSAKWLVKCRISFKQCSRILNHRPFSIDFRSRSNRLRTSVTNLAEKYNLGNPEFGNFYVAQYEPYVDTFYQQLKE